MPIRIALGEDSLIVREGVVHQLLSLDPDVEFVAAVGDELSLRQACEDEHPDTSTSTPSSGSSASRTQRTSANA